LPLLMTPAGVSVVAGQTSKAGTYNVALAQFEMQNTLKGMATSGAISGGLNAGIQYVASGEINPTDVIISTVVGGLTYGQTPATIIAANAGAGGLSAAIKGQDPIQGVIVSGLGSTVGVGANKIISNQIGRFFTPAQTGSITKPVTIWDSWGMNYTPKSLFPALSGNIGESVTSEVIQMNVNEIWNSIRNDQK